MKARRALSDPIIHAGLSASIGDNINGPSLIARPDWAPGPGRYLLYFAHHYGRHIRLAWADTLQGPWHILEPGALHLSDTPFAQTPPDLPQPDWAYELGLDAYVPHIASPDVHLNHDKQRFEMLFHGLADDGIQRTCLAVSQDGLAWRVIGPMTTQTYLRRFEVDGQIYAIALQGELMRLGENGVFEHGPRVLSDQTRHVAVLRRGHILHVVLSRYGDAPERLLHVRVSLDGDWQDWRCLEEPADLLQPDHDWEGAALPVVPSVPGPVEFVHELRDPALFEDGEKTWLIYSGGGEAALGLAEVTWDKP